MIPSPPPTQCLNMKYCEIQMVKCNLYIFLIVKITQFAVIEVFVPIVIKCGSLQDLKKAIKKKERK